MPDTVQVVNVEVFRGEIEKMQHMAPVVAALARQADAIAGRARGLAGIGDVAASVFTTEGVRPKGRRYARAISDPGHNLRGTSKNERRALLQRAADIRT